MCIDFYMASNKSNSKRCFPPSVLFPWPLQCLSSFSQSFRIHLLHVFPCTPVAYSLKPLRVMNGCPQEELHVLKLSRRKWQPIDMLKNAFILYHSSPGAKLSRLFKKKKRKELSTKGQSRDAYIQGCTKDADNILQEYTQTAIKHVHLSFFTME